MTALLAKAFEELSKLPDDRQNELARMLIEVAESDRIIANNHTSLTTEQWAEVEAALGEEGDDATEQELAALYARWRG